MTDNQDSETITSAVRSQSLIITLTVFCTATLVSIFLTLVSAQNAYAQTPVLTVTGSTSYVEAGEETTYHIELLNNTDQIVYDGVISITLPLSFTYVPSSTVILGEGWPLESREPVINGQTLTWGPYHLPAAGITAHNPYGIHTLMHDCQSGLHLDGAKTLIGNGGYVKQIFYGIDTSTTGPSDCAISFVNEAYARNLIPIIRLEGHFVNGVWQAPDPGPDGDYSEIAQAFARYVSGLPRRNTNPIYIEVWNEPDLWIEWSHRPNATQYARFFVAVSGAIKQLGDARIRVLNGALTPGNMTFLRQMLNMPGFKNAFDAWSVHCYPYNHPASYNIHNGTARYSTYAIDCYIHELNVIKSYGRYNVKVIVSETGHALGNNTFGFEGYPGINETNRANYMASAFANYWQNWPEVIAVTPFQMSDTDGQWDEFDWIAPEWPYTPHAQYTSVSSLSKPVGSWEPYGYQVNFRVAISPDVPPGAYPSQLRGSEREGNVVTATAVATATVAAPGSLYRYYFPIIMAAPPKTGPWYLSVPEASAPGAIVPTHFLQPITPTILPALSAHATTSIPLDGTPHKLALDEQAGLGAIIGVYPDDTGYLQIFNLTNLQPERKISFGTLPQFVTTDAPTPAQAYVSLANGLALVDLQTGTIIRQMPELGRLRGIARDAATGQLFVADAEHDRLLILRDDLSAQISTHPLSDQPDQVIFDSATRQIFISFPGVSGIATLSADNLQMEAQTNLTGGPIIDWGFDPHRQRLYILHALAPGYRGITVLNTPSLDQIALIAGVEAMPLQQASAITLSPSGNLLISEVDGLWEMNPDGFSVTLLQTTTNQSTTGGLAVSQDNRIFSLTANQLEIYR